MNWLLQERANLRLHEKVAQQLGISELKRKDDPDDRETAK